MKNIAREELAKSWEMKKAELKVKANVFSEHADENLWAAWEKLCVVKPMRFALVNLELPYDIAQYAQVILSTNNVVPHVATYMIGQSLDFMHNKTRNKITSWNISEKEIKWIPRVSTTLEDLKAEGFRLIGTSPNEGENALDYEWGPKDIAVIGGAKGLSRKNIDMMDAMIRIPGSAEVPFLTTPTVIPILAYSCLNKRGLWK